MSTTGRRLLLLCSQGGMGGTQLVSIMVAKQFIARGWHVRLVFPDVPEGGDRSANVALLDWAREHGVEAEAHPAMLNRVEPRTLGSMRALYRLIRDERPDVVNFHYGWSQIPARDVLVARIARPDRVVVSLHLPVGWDVVGEQAKRRTRWGARLAHAVVPCSSPVGDIVSGAGVPADKLHVIPGGIPVPEGDVARADARAQLGLPADAFVISSIARMVPEKGHADLLTAFEALPVSAERPAHLVLQGDGPLRAEVEARAATIAPDRVHFLPEDADTSVLYAASDVFALSSHAEGWPLVLMEAAFRGVPAVATAVGGVPEEVQDGVTGLVVPPADPARFTDALERVMTDDALREEFSAAARQRAYDEFTDAVMGQRYERVFAGSA